MGGSTSRRAAQGSVTPSKVAIDAREVLADTHRDLRADDAEAERVGEGAALHERVVCQAVVRILREHVAERGRQVRLVHDRLGALRLQGHAYA
jgi:hypothetical protein